MKRSLYRFSALFSVLLALPLASLSAQTSTGDDHVTPVACGSGLLANEDYRAADLNTRILTPGVYDQAIREARGEKSRPAKSLDFEIADYFYVLNAATSTNDHILAGLVYEGELVRIWLDLRDTSRVSLAKVDSLRIALDEKTGAGSRDPNKGIVRNNQDVYGPPPTGGNRDGKTDFLLTDIKGKLDAQGQVTLGFFSPRDQQPKTQQPFSNEKNLLYVDDNEGLKKLNDLLAIVSHEHQHLLHYAQNVASRNPQDGDGYTFYNEGASELASILNGYPFRTNAPYLANTNVDLLRYDRVNGGNQEVDYERSMVFLLYLYEQFGESFITEFIKVQSTGITRVNTAMDIHGINLSQRNAQDVIKSFAVANYVQKANGDLPMYGFRFTPTSGRATAKRTYNNGTGIDTVATLQIERYGSAFYVYNNAQPMTVTYSSPRQAALMVMYFKNNILVAVEERNPNAANEIGRALGTYDKIVLAFVGTDPERTTINWSVSPLTVGVRDDEAVSGALSIAAISPNPARGSAAIRYRSGAGTLSMELFDVRGERVATPVDGVSSTAGAHEIRIETSRLSPGVYMVRLSQDGKVVTRPLVVVE